MSTLKLPERLTFTEASASVSVLLGCAAQVDASQPLVFDASGVRAFDSSAFAVMLEVARKGKSSGARPVVRGAPSSMSTLARMYGVDELIEFANA